MNKSGGKPAQKNAPGGLDQKKIMTILKGVMVAAAVLMILFVIAKIYRDNFSAESNYLNNNAKSGFVFAVSSDSVIDMKAMGSGLVVLTENELIFLDSSGALIRRIQHEYENPSIDVEKSKVLLYDRGGVMYRIERRSGTVFTGNTAKSIITAALSKKGGYAIATRADNATSRFTFYTQSSKEKFIWDCASEHIVAIDISGNQKKAAVAVIGGRDAHVYSRVHIFDFNYSETYASFEYETESVFSVQYTENNTLIVYTDGGRSVIKGKEKSDEAFFIQSPRYLAYAGDGKSAFLSSRFGNSSSNLLEVFDKRGDAVFESDIDETVKWLSCSSSGVNILLGNRALTYNYKGEIIGNIALANDCVRSVLSAGNLFVLSSSGISRYKADSFAGGEGDSTTENASGTAEDGTV